MNITAPSRPPAVFAEGWLSRERALGLTLIVATAVVFYLCYRLVLPFLTALAWALALAVMCHPLHRRIRKWLPHPNLAAGISVIIVACLIVVPVIFVSHNLIREVGHFTAAIQSEVGSGNWRKTLENNPRLKQIAPWIESQLGMKAANSAPHPDGNPSPENAEGPPANEETVLPPVATPVQRAASMLTEQVSSLVTGMLWLVMQLMITFMSLFFFFRDRHRVLAVVRSLLPLSNSETNEVFQRANDTIHATIYGSLVVSAVQGTMGGLMFWLLGLPSPLIWGAVMALLAVLPMLGTFVVWAPAAAILAFHGHWIKALVLVSWGALAIGTIDNLLCPFLVGKRLRFHPLLVFFAIMGGLALFGASGVILGPLISASADALLEVWRRRTAFGRTADGHLDPLLE